MIILKRTGKEQQFDGTKIKSAVRKVFSATGTLMTEGLDSFIAQDIEEHYNKQEEAPTVEDIQDMVEDKLINNGYLKEAKAYIRYRQDRTKVREEGWRMDDLQFSIWSNKYRYEEETFDEWVERVSGGDSEVAKLIRDKKFLFGGRILAHRGLPERGKKVVYSNCYVLPKPEDNIESIFDTARDMAKTYAMGGGIGISLEKLRPRGMAVNNSAKTTTGAVSFMELYDLTTGLIGGNGRRGALMLSIPVSHPDSEEFIDIKTKNDSITKANISLMVDDAFMEAVKSDSDYCLHWEDEEGRSIEKTIRARDLFDKNVKNNWDWAEAGFLFWDTIEKWHLMSEVEGYELAGTNPCVTGDTLVLTDKGNIPIVELVGKKTNIWNGFEWSEVVPSITGYNQEILSVKLSNGKVVNCTPYHEFVLKDGSRVKAKDLTAGDKLSKFNLPVVEFGDDVDEKVAYTQGFFSGDGFKDKNSSRARIYMYSDSKKKLIDNLYFDTIRQDKKREITCLNVTNSMRGVEKDFVPTNYSVKSRLHWLAGLIDSDGAKNSSDGSINITSIDKSFLGNVSNLLNTLGVSPTVSLSKLGGKKMMPSSDRNVYKEYNTKDCYRLTINASDTRHLLDIGLKLHRVDISPNPNRNAKRFVKVDRVDYSHVADTVYCFTESKNHTGVFNGVMTGQCGELPLVGGGSCLLGSLNLSEFVLNPFTKDATFDEESFKKAVKIAVRGLNDVLDEGENLHPLEIQRESVKDYRQIGLTY